MNKNKPHKLVHKECKQWEGAQQHQAFKQQQLLSDPLSGRNLSWKRKAI